MIPIHILVPHALEITVCRCGPVFHTDLVTEGSSAELTSHRTGQDPRVGHKVSGLTYKSRVKWKMLRGIYSAIYGEVNVSVSVCVEIKGDCIEKWQSCFISVTLEVGEAGNFWTHPRP